MTPSSETRITG